MKLLIGKKLIASFTLALLLLIAISAVSRGSGARLLATAGWVTHTHETVAKLEAMSHWIERAETAQRDFLIHGEDSYLAPYDLAIRAIDQTSGELRVLMLDSPSQQHRLYRLLALVHARRDQINESIQLRRQYGVAVSLPEVLSGAGVATANAIHDVIGEMEGEEQGLLKQRVAEADASARWADLLIAVGNLLALGLVGLSGVAIYRDIVRRAQAEMALRESEARYRSLIAALSEGIVLQDRDGIIQTCNASAERALGLSAEQMVGRTSFDPHWRTIHEDGSFFPADQHPAMVTLRTGRPCIDVVMGVQKPNGELGWLTVNSQPMFLDGQAQPCAVVCSFADITERKQAEEALRAAEERFRTLVEQLPAITYVAALDEQSSTIYTSPQIETMLGFSQAEWMADHELWRKQIHPDDYERVMADMLQSQASGVPVPSEYRMIARDGRARWFRDQAVLVRNGAGQPLFMQGIMFDITERKNIDRMKNEFVSTVSHELRTPLTSIRGSLGLIAGGVAGELPAKARTMVDIAYKNSERLIRLINDILDIEKIESGKMIFNPQPVELVPLLEHAIEINRAYGQQFDVTLALESAIADVWVYADSDRLIQALTNLLGNAAKFSPPGARVLLSLTRRAQTLRIAIQDRGPGIPEAFRARLFQKFAQADASDARQKGGTGLGLSITKAIVERMGGQLDVTTEPGIGSTFFIDLPEWSTLDSAGGASPAARVLIYERDREGATMLGEER
jgi:PAS domain S-box-containing protein